MCHWLGWETRLSFEIEVVFYYLINYVWHYSPIRVKKAFRYSRPQPGMSHTKLSLGGNYDVVYKLFLPRESLVSDIPAGDENIEKLFLR
jgi:hypothetical protein